MACAHVLLLHCSVPCTSRFGGLSCFASWADGCVRLSANRPARGSSSCDWGLGVGCGLSERAVRRSARRGSHGAAGRFRAPRVPRSDRRRSVPGDGSQSVDIISGFAYIRFIIVVSYLNLLSGYDPTPSRTRVAEKRSLSRLWKRSASNVNRTESQVVLGGVLGGAFNDYMYCGICRGGHG